MRSLFFASVLLLAACNGSSATAASSDADLIGGASTDTTHLYDAVGSFFEDGKLFCTGTPVATRTITDAELGAGCDAVGFGVTAADGSGDPSGARLQGTFKLEATKGNAFEKRFGDKAAFKSFYLGLDPEGEEDEERIWGEGQLNEGYEVFARSDVSETCYSDSGGPLLRVVGNKRELVGVVSRGFPGVSSSCMHLGTAFASFGPKTAQFLAQTLR